MSHNVSFATIRQGPREVVVCAYISEYMGAMQKDFKKFWKNKF